MIRRDLQATLYDYKPKNRKYTESCKNGAGGTTL